MKRILITAFCAAVLSACGGSSGGGDGGNGGNGGGQSNPPNDPTSGRFVDNPVSGLAYSSADGNGLTGVDGGYNGAGTIGFLIGDIALGSTPFAAFITPVDLVPGATDEQNAAVTNLIRLLQTLDEDRRAANGIQITRRARDAGAGRSLNFNQTVAAFEQDPNLRAFLNAAIGAPQQGSGNVQLVPTNLARAHMRKTLDHIAQNGAPNQLPVANAGPNQLVNSGDTVILNGGASRDADPRDPASPIRTYSWRQLAGPRAQIMPGSTPAQRRFVPQTAGDVTLLFELTVTDDDGAEHSDRMNVAVRGRNNPGPGDGGNNGGGGDNGGGDNGGGDNGGGDNGDGDNGGGDSGGGDPDPVNSAPVASAASFSVLEGQPLAGNVTATDDDGDDLEFFVVDEPQSGSLDFPGDGSFTYRPAPGFSGGDSFTFKANDGADDSNVATAAITVNPIPVGLILGGAAKRSVTPLQEHIDGVPEARFAGAPHQQQFNLGGFGIDPLQNFPDPVGGFGAQLTEPAGDRRYRNDDIWVRTLILSRRNQNGSDTRIAFITLDAVGAGNIIQAGLKAAVNEATGIPEANILFGQTHSHAGADLQGLWGGVPQSWIDNLADENGLYQLAAASAREAMDSLRVSKLSVSSRELPQFNNYRRPQVNPNADADATATLLRVRAADDDAVIGSLLQYNAHPTSIGTNDHEGVDDLQGRVPHPDYITGITQNLESEGGVALFYNGPIADASPAGGGAPAGANAYETVRNRGQALASAARAGEPAARILSNDLSVRHVEALLPVTNPLFVAAGALGSFNRYYDFAQIPFADIPGIGPIAAAQASNLPQATPTARTLVSRITLGSGDNALEIVTIPGEATNTFGEYIQALAGKQTMLLGLTQNSFGYILPEEEFSYISETGETGLIVPFTNYEEFISLGPLTAPLLRIQAYNPLFDAPPEANVPPSLAACFGVENGDRCILEDLANRPDFIQRAYGETCRDNGLPEEFCQLIDPGALDALSEQCSANGGPQQLCDLLGSAQPPAPGGGGLPGPDLAAAALDASLRGCDPLDTSFCLFPFPNNHFTRSDSGTPTGLRINFNPLAMPRNIAGKPVDPTEWNRNDGFSPGQMILTHVPGLDLQQTGAAPITDIGRSLDPDTPILVLHAETADGQSVNGVRELLWSELDANAGFILPPGGEQKPGDAKPALIIRPAKNLRDGDRYVVVLRNLRNASGNPIGAPATFAACRDGGSSLPGLAERCNSLQSDVFPVLDAAGIARDETLYMAWDFTVASTEGLTSRLVHMRDDAFGKLGERGNPGDANYEMGAAPAFTVDTIIENPNSELARRIEGTFTVPSYVVPVNPSPLQTPQVQTRLRELQSQFPQELGPLFEAIDLVGSASLPPNRLFYNPLDGGVGGNPPYGDGLPDSTGSLSVRYTCNVPKSADVMHPARPSLYGHGLLGGQGEVGAGNVRSMSNEHNMMFCAADWFGFATGDVPNVVTLLLDLSFFPVIPDASQQGMLNFMYLARLLRHPDGFAANPAFQAEGLPLFDTREVFYDGNSQGGILGGPVVALSKDVNRGVLGVPGMNYSLLLRRSVDFATYSIPLYLSYTGDLERSFVFSLMQMLWDRSENNGYANHITRDPLPGNKTSEVLLHPAFGDHQVTMWSAEVMARSIDAVVDNSRVSDARHPDDTPYFAIEPINYQLGNNTNGSAIVVWDEGPDNLPPPPTANIPHAAGDDPHGFPRSQVSARCQKSHFLQPGGSVIDVTGITAPGQCPPVNLPPYVPPEANPPGGGDGAGGDNPLTACQADPSSDACPISPLVNLLSTDAVVACGLSILSPTCPLSGVVQPVADNDPIGIAQQLAAVAGNITACLQSADPLTCQQLIMDSVEETAIASGLPLSQAPNRCDLPAGNPDPVNEPVEWQTRDLVNILCSTQRLTDMAANPAFGLRFNQETPRTFSDNIFDQLDNPTRPAITLAQVLPGGTTTDPFRVIEDWEGAGRGRFQEISFIASSGAKLNGRILTPNPEFLPPYPVVVITTGSIQGYQEMYNWAAEGLAEAGYMVLTYDVQGQGESETFPHEPDGSIACGLDGCEGVPFQQDSNFFQGARDSLDFLLSTPASRYANAVPAASPLNLNSAGTNRFNPLWAQVDRKRIGLAGHSLGASAISVVGQERGCPVGTPVADRDGCVSAIVGWDAVSTVNADVSLRVPALSLTAEYFFNPTPADPNNPPDPDTNLGFFNQLTGAGIDAMHVGLRSSTHLEWTYVPYILPASRYGERVSMHYTLAWFDRYVRGDTDATDRLITTTLDTSADASSIGAGTYDVATNTNVPYRIADDCVANRLSIYQRSAYFLKRGSERQSESNMRQRTCSN